MVKYIDADLLRKEIENCKEAMSDAVGEYSDGVRFALEHFTFVLDSIQQEQQEVDLSDEIKNYFKGFYMDLTDQGYILKNPDGSVGLMLVKQIARHFFELGRLNARKEEKK